MFTPNQPAHDQQHSAKIKAVQKAESVDDEKVIDKQARNPQAPSHRGQNLSPHSPAARRSASYEY
jgi:hypothetical protein